MWRNETTIQCSSENIGDIAVINAWLIPAEFRLIRGYGFEAFVRPSYEGMGIDADLF